MDYREVRLPDDCVVYADPPYKGADGYNHQSFDHDAFWEWVRHCPHPVYVSEYSAPDDIIEVAARTKRSLISATANVKATERLFCNRAPMRTTLF